MTIPRIRRRQWLGATALSAALATCKRTGPASVQEPNLLGAPVRPYGERSEFETARRLLDDDRYLEASQTRTPLGESIGILTPSALQLHERHHSGVPRIDPAQHRLLIHGLVDRPLIFTVEDLRRLPSLSRIYFLECSGNSGSEWGSKPARHRPAEPRPRQLQ